MVVIVEGFLTISEGSRDKFVEGSKEAVLLARAKSECLDFSVSADTIDENRVNIFEKWCSKEALDNFRGSGLDNELSNQIVDFNINEYVIKA